MTLVRIFEFQNISFFVKSHTSNEKQAKGPNSVLALESATVKQTIKELLEMVRHPYILPATEANFLAGKKSVLITIRPWAIKGSLKDLIYKVILFSFSLSFVLSTVCQIYLIVDDRVNRTAHMMRNMEAIRVEMH